MSADAMYQAHTQQGILLNANENPNPTDSVIVEEIQKAIPEVAFNRYPDDEATELRQAYASWLGVDSDQIIAGNGSDQMLQLVISSFGGPEKTMMTLAPDFGMYDFYAASYHTDVLRYPLDPQKGLDVDDFIETVTEIQPDLVLFSNPNNPYGTMVSSEDIKKIADAIAPVPLISDEAYMEFGQDSAVPLLETTSNLYITRTLSKAFGMAGLRIGFLVSQAKNIQRLLPNKIVYNLSNLTQKIASIVLNHADIYEKEVQEIIEQRDQLQAFLQERKIECGPANANYLCVYPDSPEAWKRKFEKENIQIRTYPSCPYVRLTVGTPEDNRKVMHIIETLTSGEEAA